MSRVDSTTLDPGEGGAPQGSDGQVRGATAPRASGRPRFSLGNRPPLTGLRALGVTAVLVFHSNFKTLPGAWVALGIFFTLSGFLITAMLANERQRSGRISLRNFYLRRGVRLLPPLLMTVALLAIFAALVHVDQAVHNIWGDVSAAVFYYADYRSATGHEPPLGYLAQCWSLSVEEQFYLIWAIIMMITVGLGRRRLAYVMAVVGILACTADRLWIVLGAPHYTQAVTERVYYAFDTRADALFVGCLLGLLATDGYLTGWGTRAKQVLTVAALASGAVMVWILLKVPLAARSLPIWWLPVSEVASAVIIAYFLLKPEGIGSKMVGLGVLVFIGDMSYTLYLIHWPVYVAISPFGPFRINWPYWPTELLRLAIIIPIAVLSWFLVERPLMRWRRRAL